MSGERQQFIAAQPNIQAMRRAIQITRHSHEGHIAAHRMCAVGCRIESRCDHPSTYHPRILPGRKVWGRRQSTREEILLRLQGGFLEPRADRGAGWLRQFKLNGALRFSLNDLCPRQDLVAASDIANPQIAQVTAAELAVDCKVEQGEIANRMGVLEVDPDGPDVFEPQRWLLAHQLAFVPHLTGLFGLHDRLPQE